MAYKCEITENSDADIIQNYLKLNDSEFIEEAIALQITVRHLRMQFSDSLINLIPGKLLLPCQVYHFIWNVLPPIIFLLGTIGNTLAFCVLVKRELIKMSTYFYLAVLTIFDELILIIGLLRRWVDKVGGFKSENTWLICCQLAQFIGVSASLMSVWIIVIVTLERLIVIKLPLRANSYVSLKRTKKTVFFMIIFSLSICSHFFFTVSLIPRKSQKHSSKNSQLHGNNSELMCDFPEEFAMFAKIWTFVDAILYSCLPLFLMVAMNIIIGHCLYQAKIERESMIPLRNRSKNLHSIKGNPRDINHVNRNNSTNRETRQLTIILMVISCTFLITTTPLVLLKFYFKLQTKTNSDVKSLAKMELLDTIFEMLMYTNHAINFLLYCASGKKFRNHVRDFFKTYFPLKQHSQHINETTCRIEPL